MTLQEQIAEYKRRQQELWDAAEVCAQNGDDDGYIRLTAEAFFMPHPIWAEIKKSGGFSSGTKMRVPFAYEDKK